MANGKKGKKVIVSIRGGKRRTLHLQPKSKTRKRR